MFLSPESAPEVARAQEPASEEGAEEVIGASRPPRKEGAGVAIGMHEIVSRQLG